MHLQRLIPSLSGRCPKFSVVTLAALTAMTEAVLLAKSTDNVYVAGGAVPALAVAYLVWFWIMVFWGLQCAGTFLASLQQPQRRLTYWGTTALLGGIITIGFVALVVSWTLFFQTGRFANVAGLLFILQNPPKTTWLYLGPGERIAVIALTAAAISLFLLIPKILRIFSRVPSSSDVGEGMKFGFVLRTLSILLFVLAFWVIRDPSPHRSAQRFAILKSSLHPSISLLSSSIGYYQREAIEFSLDPSELTSIAEVPWSPPVAQDQPSVIFVAIESLRHDVVGLVHQGSEVTPHLNALSRNGVQWTSAYSQSTHSDYADVCIVSSLYPLRTRNHHYYRIGDPWPKTLAFDIFKQAGYDTAIISSQNEAWGGMDQFLMTDNLDFFYDANRSGALTYTSKKDHGFAFERSVGTFSAGCLYDEHTMDTAIHWINQRFHQGVPFFLSMNFQASHFPYELPENTEQPFQPCQLDADVSFMNYPIEKTDKVRNAYYNGIHHCDQQLGRLVEALQRAGQLENVILVVLGENGEAFHENGSVGHAREPVEPAIHVATVIHAPLLLKPKVETYPLEHVDLLPTVLGMLNWPKHPNFQGIDVLDSQRPRLDERLLYFHVNSPTAREDAVQWAGRWKYLLNHDTGVGRLFDLHNDPEEANDLSQKRSDIATQLSFALRNWRKRQLAFYHYPLYYKTYYPPSSPQFNELDSSPFVVAPNGQVGTLPFAHINTDGR